MLAIKSILFLLTAYLCYFYKKNSEKGKENKKGKHEHNTFLTTFSIRLNVESI